jgi:rhodanese-related sulfurtransferase
MANSSAPRRFNWVLIYNSIGITLIVLIALLVYSDLSRSTEDAAQADSLEDIIRQLTPPDVQSRIADGAVLVDVRSQNEWQTSEHIEGAISIPIAYFDRDNSQHIASLLPDKDTPIVVMCYSNNTRSIRAAEWLREQGYTNVSNLDGGLEVWMENDLPTVPFVTLDEAQSGT